MNNITLLIHGPFAGNFLDSIYQNYCKVSQKISETIIVCYQDDYESYCEYLKKTPQWNIKLVTVKDIINPGFFNINRQIMTVRAGIKNASGSFIIKLRNDQCVNFQKLFSILEKHNYFSEEPQKIITTNCYTRKDRLYHPSDMFLCGNHEAVKKYFSVPLMQETHLDHQLFLQQLGQKTNLKYFSLPVVPESYLFRNYIKKQGWKIKETPKDSFNALKKYTFLINSWDIDFRWVKARNPYLNAKSIILPSFFNIKPFEGMPKEKARCYNAHQLGCKKLSLKDIYYITLSRVLFNLKYKNIGKKCKLKTKKQLLSFMRLILKIFPYMLAKPLDEKIQKKIRKYKTKITSMQC